MAFETTYDARKQTNGASHPEDLEARLEHTRAEIDDTLAALERKLSPGELLDETLDYLSHHGPGEMITQLARELKERPLPAALSAVGAAWMTKQSAVLAAALARKPLPAALTAIGIAWWTMDSGRRKQAARSRSTAGEALGAVRSRAATAAERVQEGMTQTREHAAVVASRVGEKMTEVAHEVSATAADVGHKASATAAEVGHKAGDTLRGARDAAAHAWESRDRVIEPARRAGRRSVDAVAELDKTMRRYPTLTAVLLIGAGAVTAAMLPATRRESEMLGDVGRNLVGRVREAGEELSDAAQAKLSDVAYSAQSAYRGERDEEPSSGREPSRQFGAPISHGGMPGSGGSENASEEREYDDELSAGQGEASRPTRKRSGSEDSSEPRSGRAGHRNPR